MQYGLSTHLLFSQRLTPALLDAMLATGARQIEVFAARHHFDYCDRGAVREMANWFQANPVTASMHMPLFTPDEEANWSKHTAATLNLIDAAKSGRIAAQDEVKRALEAAEQVPFKSCVLHLGSKEDEWGPRALDDALSAVEHLKAFAGPLGVQLLLENLSNKVAEPEHLLEIVRVGHFNTVGFCLDVGHAVLAEGVPETSHEAGRSGLDLAFAAFGDRLVEMHLHDNGGIRDEHCWPGEGKVDWGVVREHLRNSDSMNQAPAGLLEIAYDPATKESEWKGKCERGWALVGV